jgi:hypothetical protein
MINMLAQQERTLRMIISHDTVNQTLFDIPSPEVHSPADIENYPQRMSREQRVQMANFNLNPRTRASRNVTRNQTSMRQFTDRQAQTLSQRFTRLPYVTERPLAVPGIHLQENIANLVSTAFDPENFSPVIIRPTEQQISMATEQLRFGNIRDPYNTVCPIRQERFNQDEPVLQILPCSHLFSPEPLRQWFRTSVRCPLCRYDIRNYNPRTAIRNPYNRTADSSGGTMRPRSSSENNRTASTSGASMNQIDPSQIADFITNDIMHQVGAHGDPSGNITFEYSFATPSALMAGISGNISLLDPSRNVTDPSLNVTDASLNMTDASPNIARANSYPPSLTSLASLTDASGSRVRASRGGGR